MIDIANVENESIEDARAAFAAIDAGRAAAAERLVSPIWYHPVLGLLLAGYVLAVTSENVLATIVAVPIFLGGVFALMACYKKITGLWISGFRAGRASWWAVAMGVSAAICFGLVFSQLWPAWIAALAAFIAVNVFGPLFDRTLRASLRNGTVVDPR